MHAAVEAAERAVRGAQMTLALYESDARELTRVEIDEETRNQLFAEHSSRSVVLDDAHESMRNEAPIKIRGVSYFVIYRLPVPLARRLGWCESYGRSIRGHRSCCTASRRGSSA